jgi:alkyl hydroperoxide reductase subunit F
MIEVHSKTACPYCRLTKEYLKKHDLPFTEILYDDHDARQTMYDQFGLQGSRRTVPQIFVEQAGVREYIGGYNDLLRAKLPDRLQAEMFNADF